MATRCGVSWRPGPRADPHRLGGADVRGRRLPDRVLRPEAHQRADPPARARRAPEAEAPREAAAGLAQRSHGPVARALGGTEGPSRRSADDPRSRSAPRQPRRAVRDGLLPHPVPRALVVLPGVRKPRAVLHRAPRSRTTHARTLRSARARPLHLPAGAGRDGEGAHGRSR